MAEDVRALLAGDTSHHRSPSEADYNLALMASYWTREPSVIAAVLWQSKLPRPKWRQHRAYLPHQIAAALARRETLAGDNKRDGVSYAQLGYAVGDRPKVEDAILRYLSCDSRAENEAGYSRLPMGDLAILCGVHRNTVTNTLDRMERAGRIETDIRVDHRNGRPVKSRWARFAAGDIARQEPAARAAG
jgi:hypothetical protein